ncbi:tetratricopeptide repeat protein [Streptacidiphilus sp. MAP5-3]|uniref:tetratricopeptide repeat protein n=1 Tax=unclassified Streptacidiphilus TaxID=2643834 RepID=UPI003513E0DA
MPSPWVKDRVALATSAAHLARGDPQAAMDTLQQMTLRPEHATAAARAHLAAGENEAARTILDSIADDSHTGPAVTVRTLLVRTQTAIASGDRAATRRLLTRAPVCARPEDIRLPFREAGPSTPAVDRDLDGRTAVSRRWWQSRARA